MRRGKLFFYYICVSNLKICKVPLISNIYITKIKYNQYLCNKCFFLNFLKIKKNMKEKYGKNEFCNFPLDTSCAYTYKMILYVGKRAFVCVNVFAKFEIFLKSIDNAKILFTALNIYIYM